MKQSTQVNIRCDWCAEMNQDVEAKPFSEYASIFNCISCGQPNEIVVKYDSKKAIKKVLT